MSAHFDGGAEIAGRRLREVEVTYVDDPTLDMGAEDSDDCPASPPPTYYLRVREEKRKAGGALRDSMAQYGGEEELGTGGGGRGEGNRDRTEMMMKKKKKKDAWAWRYVNVEKKSLLVWDRRGGQLLKTIPLKDVESLSVIPDQAAPASILEVHFDSQGVRDGCGGGGNDDSDSVGGGAQTGSGGGSGNGVEKGVLVLQARSRQETFLWAKVLQENVELMTQRLVPLENLDEETNLSDVQQLAKLLTHQLSELQDTGNKQQEHQQQYHSRRASEQRGAGVGGHIESIPEDSATDVGGN